MLRYVGITHEHAAATDREAFVLSDSAREALTQQLELDLGIGAALVVSTCNRTEIYFESEWVSASTVRDYLVNYVEATHQSYQLFVCIDDTAKTAALLVQVTNGLKSSVVGDKQIMAQVKEAFRMALQLGRQGSLLERAIQVAFRSHKRISNETSFRNGSTSTAYRALKIIAQALGGELGNRKLLIVGAGEIARDVLEYLPKFGFGQVWMANRTLATAEALATAHGMHVYDWQRVIAQDFSDFDAIITAVSHQKHLIRHLSGPQRVLVDLAIPLNIHPELGDYHHLTNVDEVSQQIATRRVQQAEALPQVQNIIAEEMTIFHDWLGQAETREFLKNYKAQTHRAIQEAIPAELRDQMDAQQWQLLTKSIANRLTKTPAVALQQAPNNQQLPTLQKVFIR